MHRAPLIDLLEKHKPYDVNEREMLTRMTAFVKAHEACFERSLSAGHVTASAWVVDPDRARVLLMHHRKLDRWFQPGGHCDGNSDTLAVACREVEEETGVMASGNATIFDIDVHLIPESRGVAAHLHYDVRYLLEADPAAEPRGNSESKEVKWVPVSQVSRYNDSESIMRMARKLGW